jgi:hypothetical protein
MRRLLVFVMAMASTTVAVSPAAATPAISVSPTAGTPTSTITVSGSGFDPTASVDVFFDTTDIALLATNASGAIPATTVTVPADAQVANHWITVDERRTHAAAQVSYVVTAHWPMAGYGPSGRGYNPLENTINTGNIHDLTRAWSRPAGAFANASPLVSTYNKVFVGDATGHLRAYSRTGTLYWTAFPGTDLEYVTPAADGARVYVSGSNGTVYAYGTSCRSDGGVCTPLWTTSAGTSVNASLTLRNGILFVPSSDGTIHQLNPATGASAGPGLYGFDSTSGAITTPIAFDADGTFYYAAGTHVEMRNSYGGTSATYAAGAVSPLAVGSSTAYYTTSDGNAHELGGTGWSAPTSPGGCAPAPALAQGLVYVGGCTTLQALDDDSGAVQWSVGTSASVVGLTVANGVLYACVGAHISAYAASYGGKLWSGGWCTGPPVVVGGQVFATYANLSAYNLTAVVSTARRHAHRPDPRRLRPDRHLRLRRP